MDCAAENERERNFEEKIQGICLIIDAQGIWINGNYYIRELSFTNGRLSKSIEFQPDLDYNEITYIQHKNITSQSELHGLNLNSKDKFAHKTSDTMTVIRTLHQTFSSFKFPYLATSNQGLVEILQRSAFPFVDISKPPFCVGLKESFADHYWSCALHPDSHAVHYYCSLRIVRNIWKWYEKLLLNLYLNKSDETECVEDD